MYKYVGLFTIILKYQEVLCNSPSKHFLKLPVLSQFKSIDYRGFLKWGIPETMGFNLISDDLGYLSFRKPPYAYLCAFTKFLAAGLFLHTNTCNILQLIPVASTKKSKMSATS